MLRRFTSLANNVTLVDKRSQRTYQIFRISEKTYEAISERLSELHTEDLVSGHYLVMSYHRFQAVQDHYEVHPSVESVLEKYDVYRF